MSRGSMVLASLFASLTLSACSRKDQLSNAEMRGQYLYEFHCFDCHESPHPELLKQPPNLHKLFLATSLPSGAPATDEQVRKTIVEGRGTMPAFDQRLHDEDFDDLVKYLHKMK